MVAINKSTISHRITDASGAGLPGVQVDITIIPVALANVEVSTDIGAEIGLVYTVTTDQDGGWSASLPESSDLNAEGQIHYYQAVERIPAQLGGTKVYAFCVPDTDSDLIDCLYTPAPPGPPS